MSSVAIKGIVNEHTPVLNPTWPGAALLGQIRGLIEQSMYNRVINNLHQWIDLFADKDTHRTPQSIRLPVPWAWGQHTEPVCADCLSTTEVTTTS